MYLLHPSKGIHVFYKYYLTCEESKEGIKSEELVLSKNKQMRKPLRIPIKQVQKIHFTHHLITQTQTSNHHVQYKINLVLTSSSKSNEQKKKVVSIAMSEYQAA